jgi:sulfite reductase (NADPH) flavoprotein alpha-component
MKSLLRQIHLVLGLSAGLVLAVMGATGALMSFEEEVMAATSQDRLVVVPRGEKLAPDVLIARLREARPDATIVSLEIEKAPERTTKVRLREAAGEGGGRADLYVDPYGGHILGPAHGAEFFAAVRRLHRWLLLPGNGEGPGRQITAIAAILLLVLGASGLYLRWPPRIARWAPWFRLDLRRPGRMRLFSLHAKIATFLVPIYIVSVFTGLWWSWDWYRDGATYMLTGRTVERSPPRPPGAMRREGPAAPATVDPAWAAFLAASKGEYETALLTIPQGRGAIRIRSVPPDAPHPGARDEWRFDPARSRIEVVRHADRTLGEAMAASMLEVHRGRFFGLAGSILSMVAAAALPLFFVTGFLLYLGRRRAGRRRTDAEPRAASRVEPIRAPGRSA